MDVAKTIDSGFEEPIAPDLSHLITVDDKPVDNLYSERQFKLLTVPLFDSWDEGKPFEAMSDVGLFYTPSNDSVVVPDFLLSLDVAPKKITKEKKSHSYFVWLYGKPPNLVVEIVSNKKGGELDRKMEIYEKIGVSYYAVHDPFHYLGKRELRLFKLEGGKYVEMADPTKMPELGLGFVLWEGPFMDLEDRWLRFVDAQGELILTGAEKARLEGERAEQEAKRADQEAKRAEQEARRADVAEARAQEMERRLRELEGG
jgi:Uma2 family endonuclease